MIRLRQEQFVILACLADYDFTGYEILDFARELGYMIPLELLFPTLQELMDIGLVQERTTYGTISLTPTSIYAKTFELTPIGANMLIDEMQKVDLLIKRIRKQVRTLQ